MNTRSAPALGIATLLLTLPAFAVTDTRDGNSPNAGMGDSNGSRDLNRVDDSAPLSGLVNNSNRKNPITP